VLVLLDPEVPELEPGLVIPLEFGGWVGLVSEPAIDEPPIVEPGILLVVELLVLVSLDPVPIEPLEVAPEPAPEVVPMSPEPVADEPPIELPEPADPLPPALPCARITGANPASATLIIPPANTFEKRFFSVISLLLLKNS
jgi:hypothetical protein